MRYEEKDLVRIAKRENNNKRSYLVVDPLQGKHVPVSPFKALTLFSSLADKVREAYSEEKLLLVGFAETATAIGAEIAVCLGAKYIQTTREVIEGVEYLYFSEEHSHATEQKLVKDDIDAVIDDIDRIVFAEDEVTTGKTILNIIDRIEQYYPGKVKFSVASLLNGMSKEHLAQYEERKINLHYLVKTSHEKYEKLAAEIEENGKYHACMPEKTDAFQVMELSGYLNARRLTDAGMYEEACGKLWQQVSEKIGNVRGEHILVLGTEEFMYPAIYLGAKLEEMGNDCLCHATTRSPIVVSSEETYPLHERYELKSLYDSNRRTLLYDIGEYDRVYVVTDAPERKGEGIYNLVNALYTKNKNIILIRWC